MQKRKPNKKNEFLIMLPENKTIAYIDGANLHRGVLSLGWRLDYSRFRIWLSDKYGVGLVYLFVGLIPKYKDRYTQLQKDGFTLVYKEVIYDGNGRAKGNCDADLVTQAMRDSYEGMARRVVLVTSDGDYAPLVKFWLEKAAFDNTFACPGRKVLNSF